MFGWGDEGYESIDQGMERLFHLEIRFEIHRTILDGIRGKHGPSIFSESHWNPLEDVGHDGDRKSVV